MKRLQFTGERMIPAINKGASLYYEHLIRYFFASQFVKDKVVLDLGCGTGYGSYIFSLGGARKVIGIDISKEAIEFCKSQYHNKNIGFLVGDVQNLSFLKEKFDIIVSFELVEHLENQDLHLSEVCRLLKDDGILVVSTPNKVTYPPGNKFHTREFSPKEFQFFLRKYFKNVEMTNQYFWLATVVIEKEVLEHTTQLLFDKLETGKSQVFVSPFEPSDCQYTVAVCSKRQQVKWEMSVLFTPQADFLNLTQGTQALNQKIASLSFEVKDLQRILDEITSAKTFKAWQTFVRIRKSLYKFLDIKRG